MQSTCPLPNPKYPTPTLAQHTLPRVTVCATSISPGSITSRGYLFYPFHIFFVSACGFEVFPFLLQRVDTHHLVCCCAPQDVVSLQMAWFLRTDCSAESLGLVGR